MAFSSESAVRQVYDWGTTAFYSNAREEEYTAVSSCLTGYTCQIASGVRECLGSITNRLTQKCLTVSLETFKAVTQYANSACLDFLYAERNSSICASNFTIESVNVSEQVVLATRNAVSGECVSSGLFEHMSSLSPGTYVIIAVVAGVSIFLLKRATSAAPVPPALPVPVAPTPTAPGVFAHMNLRSRPKR